MSNLAQELHELVLVLDRQAEKRLAPSGLSYRRYVALFIVDEHPGLGGRDLAGALSITEGAVSAIVNRLLADGLVTDCAPAGYGRRRRLVITDRGAQVLADATARLGTSLDDLVRGLGTDPEALETTLRAIRTVLVQGDPR